MVSPGKRVAMPVLLSVVVHIAAAALAGWVIVARNRPSPPSALPPVRGQASPSAPSSSRENALNPAVSAQAVLQHQSKLIRSHVLAGWQPPPLPRPADHPEKSTHSLGAFLEASGAVSTGKLTSGIQTGPVGGRPLLAQTALPAPRFLGVPVTGDKILLLFDVSRTVAHATARAGMPMQKIRDETARLIQELGIHTRFGLLEFARNYALFRPELVASTHDNRQAALQWLERYFGTEGVLPRNIPHTVSGSPGFLVVLEHAFQLDPDVLFVLSDGSFQRGTGFHSQIPWEEVESTLERLQKARSLPTKIHFVGVAVKPETAPTLRRILAKHGGTLSELAP